LLLNINFLYKFKTKLVMELQLFIYKGLAAHLYYSDKSLKGSKISLKNLIIIVPGLPQEINKDFFKNKVSKDTAFLSINYLGSHLSGGIFSYLNCQKSVQLAIELANKKQARKTFDDQTISWAYDNLILVGSSFAGNPILKSKVLKSDVKKVVLLAPLVFLNRKDVKEFLNEQEMTDFYGFNSFFLKFLQRGYKFAYRGINNKLWNKLLSGQEPESAIRLMDDYPDIVVFHGKQDKEAPVKSSQYLKQKFDQVQLVIADNVGHDWEKLFDLKKILKL